MKYISILIVALVTFQLTSNAQTKGWANKPFERKAFIENKGQLNERLPQQYQNFDYCIDNGAQVLFSNNSLVYHVSKNNMAEFMAEERNKSKREREHENEAEELKKIKTTHQYITLQWLNANPNATVEVHNKSTVDYGYVVKKPNSDKDYFTQHCVGYSSLTIKNLYRGVDAEYFFNANEGFKYNLLVSAGADVSQIKMRYTGSKSVSIKNNELHIKTIVGDIIEHTPVSFKTANTNEPIPSSFTITGDVISFNIPQQSQAFTIDPWMTYPFTTNIFLGGYAVDIGVDKYGNSYITSNRYILEKYSPTGVLLQSTDVGSVDFLLYGDLVTDSKGNCYYNTVFDTMPNHPQGNFIRGNATAVDSAGNFLWDGKGIGECWRFVLNECTNKIYSLVGVRHSINGFATINASTGIATGIGVNSAGYQDPHAGVVDNNGDVYTIASDITGSPVPQIMHFNSANILLASYTAPGSWGYASGYAGTQGYNGMSLFGDNLYLHDGFTLYKVSKTTGTIVQQLAVPNGRHGVGGIYINGCGNIFVGSNNGVYMYDLNFNQLDFKATRGEVLDLIFNPFNQTIVACGYDIAQLDFIIPPCVFKNNPKIKGACNGVADGYIKLNVTGGVPNYTYAWTKDGAPYAATTDSIGALAPGKYHCTYTDNLCPISNKDTITINISGLPSPVNNLVVKNVSCHWGHDATITNNVTLGLPPFIYTWKPTTNVSGVALTGNAITGLDTGKYVIRVDDSGGCFDEDIVIITQPDTLLLTKIADVSHCNSATAIDPITAVVTGGTAPYSYNWVGSNVVGSTTNLSMLNITTSTTLNISVDVTDANGCKSVTQTMKLNINPTPVVDFTSDSACFKGTTTFTDNSTVANGSLKSWAWVFGGTGITPVPTANIQNPTYIYNKCNNATNNATLVVTSDSGCVGIATNPVIVHCLPMPNFTFSNGCEYDDLIQFTNTSTNGAGTTSALISKWRLGLSPVSVISTNASYTYTAAGNYSINLNVIDGFGCSKDTTKPLIIYPKPVANFMVDSVCLNLANAFTNTSTLSVPAGFTDVVQSQVWNYNFDGTNYTPNTTTLNTSHIYTLPATQTKPVAMLIVTTNHNCADTVSKPVIVWPLPKANYSMTAPCYPTATTFSNASTITTGTDNSAMASMVINWGNGQTQIVTGLNQSINYNHAASGNYISKLVVTSNHGCADSLNVPITVHAKPVANYTALPAKGCEPLCVNFINTSTQNAAPVTETIATYNWNFGDYNVSKSSDNKATTTKAKHCYTNPTDTTQLHTTQLIITTTTGCKDTLTLVDSIAVYPLPEAGFKVSPSTVDMLNPELKIKDESHLGYTITWNYNNGEVKQSVNPTPLQPIAEYVYQYKDSGTYIIKQLVQTNKGCADSISKPVRVNPIYTIYVPNVFSPNGDNINDYFMVKGINIKELDLVIFDRWGEVIARITSPTSKGWDGTDIREGKLIQQEVYNWKLSYTDVFNTKHKGLVGTVTMLK